MSGTSRAEDVRGDVRTVFGQTACELGVHLTSDGTVVSWALEIRPGGELMPVQDKLGGIVFARGATATAALDDVRRRVAARFGAEQVAATKAGD